MNKKNYTALLLSAAMLFSGSASALGTEDVQTALPSVTSGDVVILHTNDVHTYIDGDIRYSHVAGLKNHLEALGAHVILVDSGDAIQGTAYGSMDQGETIHQLMIAADYDFATLGNHEFDYGMDRALEIAQDEIPYLSCNFYHEKTGSPVLEDYAIVEAGDWKLAFLGITTPEAFTKSTPAYFQNDKGDYIYGIAGGTDGQALHAAVQETLDEIHEIKDIDYVAAIGHLGIDASSQPWTSEDILQNTEGIDLFLDGHSHNQVLKEVGPTANLAQTGEYLESIGMTLLSDDASEPEFHLLNADTLIRMGVQPDAEVQALEDAWIAEVDAQLGEVIGYADITLDNYNEQGDRLVRIQETNTGDFTTDALMYLFEELDLEVDVAIMNGGGIRNKAITGELTYRSMKEIHTFGNVACLITVTGQQLLDALEWGARDVGVSENGGFLHVSGLTYTIDPSIPSTVQQDDKGVWIGGPTGAYRVKDVRLFNKETNAFEALNLNAQYNLAGYNYTLRDLGDGFAMFNHAPNVLDYVMEDYMVLANYVRSFPVDETTGLPILSSDYADRNGQKRITILDDVSAPAPAPGKPAQPAGTTYVVVHGDCLWNLAAKYLGSGARYPEIAAANGISNPYTIYIGQTLHIPV